MKCHVIRMKGEALTSQLLKQQKEALDKSQHPFLIKKKKKTVNRLGVKSNILNIKKGTFFKAHCWFTA